MTKNYYFGKSGIFIRRVGVAKVSTNATKRQHLFFINLTFQT